MTAERWRGRAPMTAQDLAAAEEHEREIEEVIEALRPIISHELLVKLIGVTQWEPDVHCGCDERVVRIVEGIARHCGNQPNRHIIPPALTLYPMPYREEEASETVILASVTWVPRSPGDEAWRNLIDAFHAYAGRRYEAAIVPANVAVESRLSQLLGTFLGRVAGKDRVEAFLETGATYSYQLNVVLPALLSFTKAPQLPAHIRGSLNRLRDLRNDLAHEGHLESPLERDDVARLLCAALFGFHYLNLVRPVLVGPTSR